LKFFPYSKQWHVDPIEHGNLKQSQDKMKQWYDKDTTKRSFKPAGIVIVLLLIHCHPLQAKCFPYSKQWHVDPIIQIFLTV
jgi:hypothetical protein